MCVYVCVCACVCVCSEQVFKEQAISSAHLLIMDMKVAFVIVCLCTLAITSTEGGIPKCCITTRKNIPKPLLKQVQRWKIQQSSGACDISALILYVKGRSKPICVDPKVKRILVTLLPLIKRSKLKASY
ncbi:C-C motif chemokine 27a [Etheostoma cragini]|uniref:C-C motif chemokine 27a n=1 Tax=Etheostoma cragini TaxID=417921 RepID=UPI00155EBB5A|nr:C-C motif chemokine 27a [Etheostoma cragini]